MERSYADLMGRSVRNSGGSRHSGHRPPTNWWRVAILLIALLITGGVIYFAFGLTQAVRESFRPNSADVAPEVRAAPVQEGERINILFMALDEKAVRSDVMMLASVDMEQKRVGVIQIPRDTRALLAGKGTIEKVNHAYAYGLADEEFPSNLRSLKTVENLLDVRIHYTVVLDMDGFKQMIDEIGGVEVDIPIKMAYDDPIQDLHIHFEPGRQELNGQKALEYVRWRHNNDLRGYPDEDLGRIRAQQQFIRTVLEQLVRPGNLISLPNLLPRLARYVESTIEPGRLTSLALLASSLDKDSLEMTTLPGIDAMLPDPETGAFTSYYIHDPVATRQLVNRLVYGIDSEVDAQVSDKPETADSHDPKGEEPAHADGIR